MTEGQVLGVAAVVAFSAPMIYVSARALRADRKKWARGR
jgi:hypothetical protein